MRWNKVLFSGEEQEPADDYEVDNEFFVPHGYLSDEEAEDEMEDLVGSFCFRKKSVLERKWDGESNFGHGPLSLW